MDLYIRVLKYIRPYWRSVTIGFIFTVTYIIFNSISMWVSADFVRTLFDAETARHSQRISETDDANVSGSNAPEDWISEQASDIRVYEKMKSRIQSVLIRDRQEDTLMIVCIIIFLSFLFKNLSAYLHKIFFYYAQLKIVIQLRNELQAVLLKLPLTFYHKRHTGNLTSVVFNDVNSIQTVLNSSFVKLFLAPMQVFFYLIVLFIISWKLTLATLVILPISGIIIIKIGQSMRRKSRRVLEQISQVVMAFQESMSAIRIVKAFAAEKKEIEKFKDTNEGYFKKAFRAKRLDSLTSPLNETLGVLIFAILLWYGGMMVFRGDGILAEDFMRFLIFLFMLFQPLKELSGLNNILQSGMAAAERVFSYMDMTTEAYEKPNAKKFSAFEHQIVFSNVDFSYDPDTPVLSNINLTINKGEMVAFVGHSGVGKSTLVDLIPRFYDIENGDLTIDGISVQDYDLSSLRDKIGIVTQETILFNDTVRKNIGYGGDSYTDEEIIRAAKNANAWEFIQQMDEGLDTMIGERGVTISGGQRQRLSIARAILKNTPILILDEATSALDTQSEKLVQRAIDNLMQNRTVLAIAHRLSTILHADKIVVMDQGKVVEIGKHQELLQRSDVYKNLYNMQFQNKDE